MKKFIFPLLLLLFPVAYGVMQGEATNPILDITGVTATDLPTATITVDVVDRTGQPVGGLTSENFRLTGELAEYAEIVSVENIRDDNLSFATVLMIDVSSSMADRPFELAKAAAREFVNSIGASDPVAIMVFGNEVQLIQDYTTDKNVLLSAIDALPLGGETNLYGGALAAVEKAAAAPTPRRAVILLSDGAHYLRSTPSTTPREAGLEAAQVRGVPVYTIGLGYGTDRSYLNALSDISNGRFFESPAPEQLVTIFGDLATLFRSLYVITLNVDVPLDGTEYDFALSADTERGDTNEDTAVLRAPIPVPLVNLSPQTFESPLDLPVEFTAEVISDEQANGIFNLTGEGVQGASIPPGRNVPEPTIPITFTDTFQLDPFTYPPGSYTLTYTAADESGDVGTASVDFQIAAIPAVVNSLSPDLSTLGELSEPTTVTLDLSEQTPTTGVVFSVDGEPIGEDSEAPFEATIDPALYTPGEPHTLTAEVTSESGAVATIEQTFTVAAFAPQITIAGLQADELIEANRVLTVEVAGQTPATSVVFAVDGETLYTDDEAPFEFTLVPFDFDAALPHVLTVTATNQGGQTATVEVPFSVIAPSPTPTLTPTSTFTPTFTPTPTIDFPATDAAATALVQTTLDAQATSDTRSTSTAQIRATANAASTLEAGATATAEQDAANIGFTATAETDNATLQAQETESGIRTATAEQDAARVGLTATADADNAALQAQETESGIQTATAEQDAANVGLTATAETDNATLQAQETESSIQTATAEQDAANIGLTATAETDNATLQAQETESGIQTTTADADNAATQAGATLQIRQTGTAEQSAALRVATRSAQATASAVPTNTPTTQPTNTSIPTNTVVPTDTAAPTETIMPTDTAAPTDTALPTESATDTAVPTEATTEEATPLSIEDVTEEATEVAQVQPTAFDPTVTPVSPTEITAPGTQDQSNNIALLAIACGVLLLVAVLLFILFGTRRRR